MPIHRTLTPSFSVYRAISHLWILVFQGVCLYFICQIICHINMVVFSSSILFSSSVIQAFEWACGVDRDPGPAHLFTHPSTHPLIHSFTIQSSIHLSFVHSLFHSFNHSSTHSFIHSFLHPLIPSSTHSFIHSSIHSSIHSLIHPSTHSFIHQLIHSSTHLFIHPATHPFTHSSTIQSFIHSFSLPFIFSSIHPSIHSFDQSSSTRSFVHSFIHSLIYSFIHLSMNWSRPPTLLLCELHGLPCCLTHFLRTSLVAQWLRLHLPMQGTRVPSLVGELRSHMPQGNEALVATTEPVCSTALMPQLERSPRHS